MADIKINDQRQVVAGSSCDLRSHHVSVLDDHATAKKGLVERTNRSKGREGTEPLNRRRDLLKPVRSERSRGQRVPPVIEVAGHDRRQRRSLREQGMFQ
jgi:hypothetical protein